MKHTQPSRWIRPFAVDTGRCQLAEDEGEGFRTRNVEGRGGVSCRDTLQRCTGSVLNAAENDPSQNQQRTL